VQITALEQGGPLNLDLGSRRNLSTEEEHLCHLPERMKDALVVVWSLASTHPL
jgi:hypothetical protein